MTEEFRITVTNGDDREVEVEPVVMAMMRILFNGQTTIIEHREGSVELHFVRSTSKVSGKLKSHLGLEKFGEQR